MIVSVVSVFIIIFASDWSKDMDDSPNNQQIVDNIRSKLSEIIFSDSPNDQQIVDNIRSKLMDSEIIFSDSEDSKSSDDGDYDDYWKHVRKSKERGCDDLHKYEPKEEQKKVTESKQQTFYFDP